MGLLTVYELTTLAFITIYNEKVISHFVLIIKAYGLKVGSLAVSFGLLGHHQVHCIY
jgi:hypothetical protein